MTETAPVPGLYIHIPFCKTKCLYCDFYSVPDTHLIDDFLHALFREADASREGFEEFDTVYLGGGTPSVLSVHQIGAIIGKVRDTFRILPGAEITVEVNPADWGPGDLKSLQGLGVNRISIGVQSFDDDELSFLGRRHSCRDAVRTIEDAGNAGFDNIGMDLIYSLPGRTFEQWRGSLEKALTFHVAHLSCYELELKPRTPLGLSYHRGELPCRTEETQLDFFMGTSGILEASGYIHYEVSNFARGMDLSSRHNRKYWDHTPYLGLGPSAHSFRDGRRWWNHDSVKEYLRDLDAGTRPVKGSELLGSEQLALEALFLGLRTRSGIDLEQYRRRYGCDLMEEHGSALQDMHRRGLIETAGGFIRPTRAGMAVADALALL